MNLLLELTGGNAGGFGLSSRKVFARSGGSIGRLAENEWMLQHREVSKRHALVRYENGTYTIEDTKSSNGVFINSRDHRLAPGERYPLKNGDTIYIEPFEIRATLETVPQHAMPAASDPFGTGDPFATPGRPPSSDLSDWGVLPSPVGQPEAVDPLELLGLKPPAPAPAAPRVGDLSGGSPIHDYYRPPAATPVTPPAPDAIPDKWWEDTGSLPRPSEAPPSEPQPAEPQPRPVRPRPGASESPRRPDTSSQSLRPSAPPPQSSPPRRDSMAGSSSPADQFDLREMLTGAGLDPASVTPELARTFGQILRVVVSGMMDVQKARQVIKDELGVQVTMFRPADNNPLKFSANVEDALHNLLVKRNAAYLGPVDAFEDAFDDLRNHQMATLEGIRVAFESMLAEFDPDRLQEQFDRSMKRGSLLSVPAKLLYWEMYREKFGDMVRDAEASYADLFGDEFKRAYEEQLRRLKAQGRSDKR